MTDAPYRDTKDETIRKLRERVAELEARLNVVPDLVDRLRNDRNKAVEMAFVATEYPVAIEMLRYAELCQSVAEKMRGE